MPVYYEFAEFYTHGPYTAFSQHMAERIPKLLERWEVEPEVILDVACGEGTFAVEMAKLGYQVVGVDRSPRMLRLAREKADAAGVEVDFRLRDMTRLIFEDSFDLATCWFDSLNYIWALSQLQDTFERVYRGLRPGGLFIFDMNTVYGLANNWADPPVTVQLDTDERMIIHQSSFDYEMNMAQCQITAFRRQDQTWTRIDETHVEKAYYLWEIRKALREAGFRIRGELGSLDTLAKVEKDDPRVWFVCQKPFETKQPDEESEKES